MNTTFVTIFFDFEGQWGMPFKGEYDLERTMYNILAVLDRYHFKAVFNTCGVIAKVHPHIIKELNDNGHELAIHGYVHEHLDKIDIKTLAFLLEEAESDIFKLTGKRPLGFRAPYLLAPKFYNREIYALFERRGYKWTSNRGVRCVDEIFQPTRAKGNILDKVAQTLHSVKFTNNDAGRGVISSVLNAKLLITDNIAGQKPDDDNKRCRLSGYNIGYKLKWLLKERTPFYRGNILEIPVLSPLDGDLLNLPNPADNSSQELIDFGTALLKEECKKAKKYFNFNFHDWIIGTKNRLQMLDALLHEVAMNQAIKVILANEIPTLGAASTATPHVSG